nr:MAG TPA: hypothetical protein [Caudoviricetes sp.]
MVEQLIPYYVKKSALKYGNHPPLHPIGRKWDVSN